MSYSWVTGKSFGLSIGKLPYFWKITFRGFRNSWYSPYRIVHVNIYSSCEIQGPQSCVSLGLAVHHFAFIFEFFTLTQLLHKHHDVEKMKNLCEPIPHIKRSKWLRVGMNFASGKAPLVFQKWHTALLLPNDLQTNETEWLAAVTHRYKVHLGY